MGKDNINKLIRMYLDNTASDDQRRTVETHFLFYLDGEQAKPRKEQLDRSFTDSYVRIRQAIRHHGGKRRRFYSVRWLPYVAATLLLIGVFSTLIFRQQPEPLPNVVIHVDTQGESICPGGNRARLTLDGGKVIELSEKQQGIVIGEGEIAYVDGTQIVDRNEGSVDQSYTLETPKGGTYQVRLPDGTEVWLNAATRINYAANFGKGDKRKIQLDGEAYFEVMKDKSRPFMVETEREKIEVLGTRFNVNSYTDEAKGRTTLVEGSVKINGNTVLNPGEQAVVSQNGDVMVQEVNTSGTVAWKNDKFVFESERLPSVMQKIGRWYNVDTIYEGSVSDKTFTGTISRFEDIDKLLQIITYTSNVKFKIKGRRITVMPAT